MVLRYNLKNIRVLLTEGFSVGELRRLCYDTLELRSAYDQLAPTTGKAEIIDVLMEHTEQKLQITLLLSLLREANSARYDQHQPYCYLLKLERKPGLRDFRRWLQGE